VKNIILKRIMKKKLLGICKMEKNIKESLKKKDKQNIKFVKG